MEPRIQYVTAADGVSIAYWAMGEGPAIVMPPPALPWSHIEREWQMSGWRDWLERFMRGRRLVRFDSRGAGLSERNITDFSQEKRLLDLEAVVDRLGLETFALEGFFYSSMLSIEYAARHPERVSHLLLWSAFARGQDAREARPPQLNEALERLLELDWDLFTETLAHTLFGWGTGDSAHDVALYMRESLTPEACRASWAANDNLDVSHLLPLIQAPTLVIHRREATVVNVDVARGLASRIPNATLAIVEGSSLAPYIGDTEAAWKAIDEFLGDGVPVEASLTVEEQHGHEHHEHSGTLATILFTDIEGSGALTQRLGDAGARNVLRTHERIVRDALHSYGGSEVKTMGDGFMASFQSASQAIACAIAMQRAFATHNDDRPETPLRVRIGLNAGEPIAEDDDLFGTTVTMTSRIMAQASAGEIVAANVVRELAAGKGFLFADRGETVLRGFEDPVRLYEVRWRDE